METVSTFQGGMSEYHAAPTLETWNPDLGISFFLRVLHLI